MKFGAYLTGPFGQSEELYKVRNEAKRGRGTESAVPEQIQKDTQRIIQLQQEAGLDFILDPLFKQYYLFQSLAEHLPGITAGPQENWLNNNVFYWRPQIQGPLKHEVGFSSNYLHFDLLPKNGLALAILPSPYTLLTLSDVKGYQNKKSAIADLAQLLQEEAQNLVQKGIARIQYDEPVLAVKQSLQALEKEDLQLFLHGMMYCGVVRHARTSIQTYFGNAGPLIPVLVDTPMDCLGLDGTETNLGAIKKYNFGSKELALGLLDARNTALPTSEDLIKKIIDLAEQLSVSTIWITPNTGTEYRGWSHGHKVVAMLKAIKEGLPQD